MVSEMAHSLLENQLVGELLKILRLSFYGTQGFITIFTRVCHKSLSWTRLR